MISGNCGMGCLHSRNCYCCDLFDDELSDMEDIRPGTNIEIFSGANAFKLYAVKNNEIQSKINIPKAWIEGKHCTIHTDSDVEIKVEGTVLKIFNDEIQSGSSPEIQNASNKSSECTDIDVVDSAIKSPSSPKCINNILKQIDTQQRHDMIKGVNFIEVSADLIKKCTIVNHVSPSEFYVTLNENVTRQQFIEDEANSSISGTLRSAPICEVQMQCLITEGELQGSRGVISAVEEDKITVKLLDIGREIVVTEDMLAGIPEQIDFSQVEAQAIKCSLYRFNNNRESADMLKFIAATGTVTNVQFIGCKKGSWHVSLIRTSNLLIKEYEPIFMALGYAAQPKLESGNAYIGYVDENNRQLWLQKGAESDVYEQIANICGTKGNQTEPLHAFNIGDPCLCKSVEDDSWYRAVVCSYGGEGDVCVQYVDYGNVETLPCKNVKSLLKDDIMHHHPLTYPCIVKDDEKLADFTKMHQLLNAVMQVTVHRKVGAFFEVSLSLGGMNIIEKTSPPNGLLVPHSVAKLDGETKFIVSHVEEDGSLWVQDTDQSEALDKLMESIGLTEQATIVPSVGLYCCCQYTDDVWYRAVVISVEDTDISVRYIDYGNCETTTVDKLKPLDLESSCLAIQAIECSLLDESTNEILKSETFVDMELFNSEDEYSGWFVMHGDNGMVLSRAKTAEGGNLCEAVRKTMEGSVVVEQSGAASSAVPAIAPFEYQNNVPISLLVSEVEPSGGFFWVQSAEREDELLDLGANITSHMSGESACKLSGVTTGTFCISMYPLDNVWYRSQVIDLQGDSCSVRFIDYGNCSYMNMSELYDIPEKLLALPTQAVRCSFKVLKGKTITDKMQLAMDQLTDTEDAFAGQLEESDGEVLLYNLTLDGNIIDKTLLATEDGAVASLTNGAQATVIQEFEVGTWQNDEYSPVKENGGFEEAVATPTSQKSFKEDSAEPSESENQKEFHSMEHSDVENSSQDNQWADVDDEADPPTTA